MKAIVAKSRIADNLGRNNFFIHLLACYFGAVTSTGAATDSAKPPTGPRGT
jgi:hypothetical protein